MSCAYLQEFDGIRNEMSTSLDELRSSITDETTEKIDSAVSELHDTITDETTTAIESVVSDIHSTIADDTTEMISTAVSELHETVTGETNEAISTANSALHSSISAETTAAISSATNDLYSTITAETSDVISSANSELHTTISTETSTAISSATSELHTTISTETSTAISTAIAEHETSESPLETKRAKITISPSTQETSETVPKYVDNHMRTLNHADTIFCGRILQPNITSATGNIAQLLISRKLRDVTTDELAESFIASNYFKKCSIQMVKYNDGHCGLRLVNPIDGKDEHGLDTVNEATDGYGNKNQIISEDYDGYSDMSSVIASLVYETQVLRAKISQLESSLETLQAKHDGSEEIV